MKGIVTARFQSAMYVLCCLMLNLLLNYGVLIRSEPVSHADFHPLDSTSDLLIVGTLDGTLFGLSRDSGAVRWSLATGHPLVTSVYGNASGESHQDSPTIVPSWDGRLFFVEDGELVQLPIDIKELVEASPFQSPVFPGTVFLGTKQTRVFSINPNSGRVHKELTSSPAFRHHSALGSTVGGDGFSAHDLPTSVSALEASVNALKVSASAQSDVDIDEQCVNLQPKIDDQLQNEDEDPVFLLGRSDYIVRALEQSSGVERWRITVSQFSAVESNADEEDTAIPSQQPLLLSDRGIQALDSDRLRTRWTSVLPSVPVAVYSLVSAAKASRVLSLVKSAVDEPTAIVHFRSRDQAKTVAPSYSTALVKSKLPRLGSTTGASRTRMLPGAAAKQTIAPALPPPSSDDDNDIDFDDIFPPETIEAIVVVVYSPLFLGFALGAAVPVILYIVYKIRRKGYWFLVNSVGSLWRDIQTCDESETTAPANPSDSLTVPTVAEDSVRSEPIQGSGSLLEAPLLKRRSTSPAKPSMTSADPMLVVSLPLSSSPVPMQTDTSVKPLLQRNGSASGRESRLQELASSDHHSFMESGRYARNFEEIKILGRGGFGAVFQARHRLDGQDYAVKKIRLRIRIGENIKDHKVFREVATMLKLNHKNVVRYITCWIEDAMHHDSHEEALSECSETDSMSELVLSTSGFGTESSMSRSVGSAGLSSDSLGFTWERSSGLENVSVDASISEIGASLAVPADKGMVSAAKSIGGSMRRPTSVTMQTTSLGEAFPQAISPNGTVMLGPSTHIYLLIQMEFCPGMSLKEWLSKDESRKHADPLSVDLRLCYEFFVQLVEGVKHIHEQGIIHRDLKPANIFIYGHRILKIGDFGLAKDFSASRIATGSVPTPSAIEVKQLQRHQSLSNNIGTPTYLSPEQTKNLQYDEKVDIYSLGLILLEMVYPFTTEMERFSILANLRDRRTLPERLRAEREVQSELIMWLSSEDPLKRPSAPQLLDSSFMKQWRLSVNLSD
eukprot:GILK01005532.1.p1 GENE.GILK01005532.1~~GILK01005532.1.p1  ORF type:complete len:1011 (-),score=108.86 GILK01005532.1:128-3160(-)